MRILYVGTLSPFGTCYSRFCSLQKLEPDIHGFDTDQHLAWDETGPLHRALETHLLQGPRLRQANAALIARCQALRPDVVWVDTGVWIWPETLLQLKEQGCFLIAHITDALTARHWRVRLKRRLLTRTARHYDVFFTTNVPDQQALSERAPPTALLTDLGYDDQRFTPGPLAPELAKKWANPLVFVGHYEPHTAAGVLALIDGGLPVTVYGHPPWFASPHRARLGNRLQPSLGNADYARALRGADIGLCFVSILNYNQTSARSFEIPGSGTFLLAVRTPQHLACFEEGKEAEFFADNEELVTKARYYLANPGKRAAIARRGQARCVSSGYSWDRLLARDWPAVQRLYAEHRP